MFRRCSAETTLLTTRALALFLALTLVGCSKGSSLLTSDPTLPPPPPPPTLPSGRAESNDCCTLTFNVYLQQAGNESDNPSEHTLAKGTSLDVRVVPDDLTVADLGPFECPPFSCTETGPSFDLRFGKGWRGMVEISAIGYVPYHVDIIVQGDVAMSVLLERQPPVSPPPDCVINVDVTVEGADEPEEITYTLTEEGSDEPLESGNVETQEFDLEPGCGFNGMVKVSAPGYRSDAEEVNKLIAPQDVHLTLKLRRTPVSDTPTQSHRFVLFRRPARL